MSFFIQQLLNGLLIGATYALVAIGLTMIFGVLKILHIAHAVMYTIGAYAGMVIYLHCGNFVISIIAAMAVCSLVGIIMHRLIYRPILNQPRDVALIASVGILIAMADLIRIIFGSSELPFDVPLRFSLKAAGLRIGGADLLIIISFIVAMAILIVLLQKTRMGFAARAIAQNEESAHLMGINVINNVDFIFLLGSAMAALGGVLMGVLYNAVYPYMGDVFSYKAVAIIVMGGFGSVPGTIIASLFLGLIENFAITYTDIPLTREGIAMLFLMILLLAKPQGLFGKE